MMISRHHVQSMDRRRSSGVTEYLQQLAASGGGPPAAGPGAPADAISPGAMGAEGPALDWDSDDADAAAGGGLDGRAQGGVPRFDDESMEFLKVLAGSGSPSQQNSQQVRSTASCSRLRSVQLIQDPRLSAPDCRAWAQ